MTTNDRPSRSLPTGTVTFLRTDVEGSMRLVHALGSRWDEINGIHLGLLLSAVDAHGGVVVRTEGDALFAAFGEARAATDAAVAAQRALGAHAWPEDAAPAVRMGLHSGEAHLTGDDYGGFEVNRAARIAAAGHGGQIVLSSATRALVSDALHDGVIIRDLGRHALRGVPTPEQLFQLDVPGLPSRFPPLRTGTAAPGDLPTRMTSFVGRDLELEEIAGLLADRRLVTLTGPGGIGKTSLAVETARSLADRYADGAWFVALADVEDPADVRPTIARTLGMHDGPGRPADAALAPYLAERTVLLVLDNFERLLDAAGVVTELLAGSAGTRILVTSRAPLRVPGEQEYPVRPLGDASVRLFVDRARAVRPGWEPGTEGDLIDEVCRLVDRLPLGVELAAARVAHLPLQAVLDRLMAHLPLPGSGPRDVPDRQRTLAGAIAWSHDMLGPALQRSLHDLAVFEGGFDLEQAERVLGPTEQGDVLDDLMDLADQSLIQRDEDAVGTGIRFRMLATIRAFALERLDTEGRDAEVRRRHADAYLALAEAAAPNLPGPDQPRWLDRLAMEYPNLRAGVRWAMDAGETDLALRFVSALWRFWQQDGRLVEATELAEGSLGMPGAGRPTLARVGALSAAGGIAYWHGRPDDARRHYEEELALARQLGDIPGEADATWNLCFDRSLVDDPAAGESLLQEARRLYERLGDEGAVARIDWSLMTVGRLGTPSADQLPSLMALAERFDRIGDTWYAAQNQMTISWTHLYNGDLPESSRWFTRSLAGSNALRDLAGTTIALPLAALLANLAERPEDAAALLGAHAHLGELYGVRAPRAVQELLGVSDPRAAAVAALGETRYAEAFERGRQMTLDEAVALTVRIQAETWGSEPAPQ